MVLSREKTVAAYRAGISAFGVENYASCGAKKDSGFLAVAQCLADAKKKALTVENMASKYAGKA